MFKILRKSTYDKLTAEIFDASEKLDELSHALEDEESRSDALERENANLKEDLAELQQKYDALQQEHSDYVESTLRGTMNEVVMQIGDNLTQLNPLVRWKPGVEDKLVEAGYLADGHITKTAIQLALMMIAAEGIEQILEDHQPVVKETE